MQKEFSWKTAAVSLLKSSYMVGLSAVDMYIPKGYLSIATSLLSSGIVNGGYSYFASGDSFNVVQNTSLIVKPIKMAASYGLSWL